MKLIFLDIDGVLVTRRPGAFEVPLLHNLQSLVSRTGAEIVLSSDWRRHPAAREEARRVLASVGLKIIGCTPCLSAFIAQRPTEIMQWRRDFAKRGGENVTQWVAIDDRPLLEERHGQYLRGHFVQTHPLRGLTEQAVEECVRVLSRQEATPSTIGASEDGVDSALLEGRAGAVSRGTSAGAAFRPGTHLAGPPPDDRLVNVVRAKSAAAASRPMQQALAAQMRGDKAVPATAGAAPALPRLAAGAGSPSFSPGPGQSPLVAGARGRADWSRPRAPGVVAVAPDARHGGG